MTTAAVFEAVRDRFKVQVVDAQAETLVCIHDNAPDAGVNATWVRLTVVEDSTEQIATGGTAAARYRIFGHALAECYAPVARGDSTLIALKDDIVAAFRSVVLSTPIVYFQSPYFVGAASRDDNGGFRRTVTIPFEADVFG